MADTPVIEIDNVRKTFPGGWLSQPVEALKGVSFDVQPGQAFGLLGPNGAGKTTIIKVMLGIVRGSGGEARLFGEASGGRSVRKRLGYLPENLRIPRHHTALTAMELYGRLCGLSRAKALEKTLPLLEMVGLEKRMKDSVSKYSKGMLQRLGLAQAMIHDPDLLILDEPTDGLDPMGRSQVRSILTRLKESGKTVFINSHILAEVELICDQVAILDRGTLRYAGGVSELSQQGTAGKEELQLELELLGSEEVVRKALSELSSEVLFAPSNSGGARPMAGEGGAASGAMAPQKLSMESSPTGPSGAPLHLRVKLTNQAEVDRVIDLLRQAKVSIIGLRRQKISLEDAFMKLMQQPPSA